MTKDKRKLKAILKQAIAALPEKTYLFHIDRDDELRPEQMQQLLTGEKDAVMEEVTEHFNDSDTYPIDELLNEAVPDEDDRESLKEDIDSMQQFRDECYNRDQSTPFDDLLNNTGRIMVRFHILDDKGERVEQDGDSWRWDDAQTEAEGKKLAAALGFPYEAIKADMDELTANASYGGNLCVLGYVDAKELGDAIEHILRNEEKHRVKLTFIDPHILVHDGFNGSGHDVDIKGEVTINFGAKEMRNRIMCVDAKGAGTGYSWSDDIAGVVKTAYEADPTIELL